MRFSRVVRDLACVTANAKIATVLGLIPASSDTLYVIWGAVDEAVLNKVIWKNNPIKQKRRKRFTNREGKGQQAGPRTQNHKREKMKMAGRCPACVGGDPNNRSYRFIPLHRCSLELSRGGVQLSALPIQAGKITPPWIINSAAQFLSLILSQRVLKTYRWSGVLSVAWFGTSLTV
jgi:hypothetical protein